MRILFITKNEKILFDNGKIGKVKSFNQIDEMRFVKKVKLNLILPPIGAPVVTFGYDYVNERYTADQLFDKLRGHSFIVYINHEKRKIELFLDTGEVDELYYPLLDFFKYFFAFLSGGIILESANFYGENS